MSTNSSDHESRFEADLFARVKACGVDEGRCRLGYEDELQTYVLRIEGGPLTETQILDLMAATWTGCHLEFADADNTRLQREETSRIGARLMKAQAEDLLRLHPDFPRFDPTGQNLSDYARTLEAYCDITPGTALFVTDGGGLNIGPLKEPVDLTRFGRLCEAVTMASAGARPIVTAVIGGDSGS